VRLCKIAHFSLSEWNKDGFAVDAYTAGAHHAWWCLPRGQTLEEVGYVELCKVRSNGDLAGGLGVAATKPASAWGSDPNYGYG
jgi:hypothetical protein